jgi:uncharacterized iron-regulated membrane protein
MSTTTDPPVPRADAEPDAGGGPAPLPTAFPKGSPADRRSRFWRTVWRTHFYAGMFVIPFMVLLAITGTLILYDEPINDITDHHLTHVAVGDAPALPLDDQVAAAQAAHPDLPVGGVTPPEGADRSTIVALDTGEESPRQVFVDPYSGDVLGSKVYRDDVPGLARALHGRVLFDWKVPVPTLAGLLGDEPAFTDIDVGDLLIELAASWGVVLVISGAYLWWPRKREAGKALFRPRLAKKGRARWRDLHAVPGAFLALILLFLVVTGLPWSGFWGGNYNHIANELSANTNAPEGPVSADVRTGDVDRFGNEVPWATSDRPVPESAAPSGDHAAHGGEAAEGEVALPAERLSLEQVSQAARQEGMIPGYSLSLPVDTPGEDGGAPSYGTYTVTNDFTTTATERTIYLDQFTGEVVDDHSFADYGPMGKFTAWGVDVHMGTEYGLANRIVITVACVLVVWSAVSGLVMWWKRRPQGKAGLPRRPPDAHLERGLIAVAVVTGVLFPLVGVSMVAIVLLDRFVIRRVPRLRQTFGMR